MAITIGNIGEEMNLNIKQGATFGPLLFTMQNPDNSAVNLTGCTVRGQIRKVPTKPAVAAAFTCSITNAAAGQYQLLLTEGQTAAIKAVDDPKSPENVYYWDLELVDSQSRVISLYWGKATIFREITRV